jgi:hypothetical protein
MFTPERIVLFFSPLLIAFSGGIVMWIGKNFPGHPQLDENQLTAYFLAGAVTGIGALIAWIKGRIQQSSDRKMLELHRAAGLTADQPGE